MNKKGQSAIEYLTTYGWMILTVAIVSSVAYSSFGNECVESSSGFVGQSIQVQDFGLTTDNELAIALENSRPANIEVEEIVVEGESITVDDGEIDPGSTSAIRVDGFEEAGECNNIDLEIVYSIESLDGQRSSGSLTGPFSVGGESPAAPDDLFVRYGS